MRLLLALTFLLIAAAPARAMTVSSSGSVITISAEQESTENHIGYFGDGSNGSWNGETEVDGYSSEETLSASGDCSMGGPGNGYALCSLGGKTLINVLLKGGDDFWDRTSGGFVISQQIDAGPGHDRIEDGTAPDTIDGGEGDDTFRPVQSDAGDVFIGGPGFDTIDYSLYTGGIGVTLGTDGNGGDGESDDLRADVERVVGTPVGDDLTAGPFPSSLAGGGGGDTLHARNGVTDGVDCGGGTDVAVVDFNDAVSGCETVDRAAEPDGDGDGSPVSADCDDGNAAVRPGATEIPGNGRDDDCTGGDAAAPQPPVVEAATAAKVRKGRFRRLAVIGPNGATVSIRCLGKRKRCPKGTLSLTIGDGLRVAVPKRYRSKRLKRGATIEITVTAPGTRGLRFAYTLRPPRKPKLAKTIV